MIGMERKGDALAEQVVPETIYLSWDSTGASAVSEANLSRIASIKACKHGRRERSEGGYPCTDTTGNTCQRFMRSNGGF